MAWYVHASRKFSRDPPGGPLDKSAAYGLFDSKSAAQEFSLRLPKSVHSEIHAVTSPPNAEGKQATGEWLVKLHTSEGVIVYGPFYTRAAMNEFHLSPDLWPLLQRASEQILPVTPPPLAE